MDLHILKNPCIPRINPTWLWYMSLLMCCWILFAEILLRIFASVLITCSVQFSCSVVSDSLRLHELQHSRPPCPSPTPVVYSNSCPSESVMPSSHFILCHPLFLLPPIPPSIRVFLISQLFTWSGQSIGVSASALVLPVNTQDRSPLGWTGWISLQSKGLSRVFSNTTFKSINSSALSFLHSPTLTSIPDHWKNHSLDQKNLCWQSNVSAF